MPGKVTVVLPTLIASEATTKNQLPDIDIIMFQMSCGMAKGTSSCQNRIQALSLVLARGFFQLSRHCAQRLVKAERHVPSLAGENRKDRSEFGAEHAPGREAHEKHDGNRNESENWHRLQNVEQRHQEPFGGSAFRGKRRVGKGEDERQHHRNQHAQRGARGIFREIAWIERGRLPLQFGQWYEKIPACLGEKNQKPEDQENGENVPSAEQTGPAAN